MMDVAQRTAFDQPQLDASLASLSDNELDELDFGTIGFDAAGVVRRYNRFESEAAGLHRDRVVGRALFTDVAPCMNNFMVAQRFADAAAAGEPLDAVVDYVLTLRMKPTRVVLRLVARPGDDVSWVLVQRRVS
jgi:photoactive yellow protein